MKITEYNPDDLIALAALAADRANTCYDTERYRTSDIQMHVLFDDLGLDYGIIMHYRAGLVSPKTNKWIILADAMNSPQEALELLNDLLLEAAEKTFKIN